MLRILGVGELLSADSKVAVKFICESVGCENTLIFTHEVGLLRYSSPLIKNAARYMGRTFYGMKHFMLHVE